MPGTSLLTRRSAPQRITDQAWHHLTSAVTSAGAGAREAVRETRQRAEGTGELVGAAANEAWRRATDAYDALAGRRGRHTWAWIVGAAAVGAVLGWMAGTAARAMASRDDINDVEFVELTPPDEPTPPSN